MNRLYTLISAIFLSVSCSDEVNKEDSKGLVLTVTATTENTLSKISSEGNSFVWEKGDNIYLHIAGNKNIRMELTEGEGSATGTFNGVILSDFKDGDMATAIYPYYESSSYSENGLKGFFPARQEYSRLSAVMVGMGYSDKNNTVSMSLRNAFAVLRFSLTGSGESVSQILVESNNGETMSGEFLIKDLNSLAPTFYGTDNSIVLSASGSSPLSENPLTFEIAVPAICYKSGLKLKISTEDSYMEYIISGSQELILERNHTYNFGNLQYVPEKNMDENKIKRLHVISQSGFVTGSTETKYAYMLLISSLQGLLNSAGKDAIYLQTTNDLDWSDILGEGAEEIIRWGKDYKGMIRELLSQLSDKKYILMEDFSPEGSSWITDNNEEKLAIASSYAAAHQSIILQECIAGDELFSGFRCIEDARGKTMEDVYDLFVSDQDLFSKDGIISAPRMPHRNVDMAISHRWVSVKSDDPGLTGRFFSEIKPLSPRFSYNGPYGIEGQDVTFSSSFDLYSLATGWCSNISTHERTLSRNTDKEVNKRRHIVDYNKQDVHYVCILMSDGGNLEYFDKKFRECFEHENYGKFPLSFMMTPALKKYKPAIQQWYMDNISDNCSFITLKSASNLNGNLNCSKELEHYAS